MVGEVVVVTWQVRKSDRKPVASFAREPFGVSLTVVSRGDVESNVEVEGNVGGVVRAWAFREDD